ncbi:hypothetical protein A0H76_158 [Hepatospora eriocheir]|uniref:Uncharacterized protein n=1 Tax=Hepatospora eriocheir TaxID=1081669 RepID=A0A1X0QEU3_9MICR|nr:hypothetical protein A0H76_158 [Hepatospora eriocheir]
MESEEVDILIEKYVRPTKYSKNVMLDFAGMIGTNHNLSFEQVIKKVDLVVDKITFKSVDIKSYLKKMLQD